MEREFEFSDGFDAVGWYIEQMSKDPDWEYYHDRP